MSDDYKIKEVRVQLKSGALVVAEASSLEAVKKLLVDVSSFGGVAAPAEIVRTQKDGDQRSQAGDDPYSLLEIKASMQAGTLSKAKIVAFKDNAPHLLKPNAFSNTTDAVLVLLLCLESGLKMSRISLDAFRGLYESQNIKSGSPLRIILTNLRAAGYINKSAYMSEKTIVLTGKGENKGIEALQSIMKTA